MFNSTILDVAVGLIFTFLAVSLVASTVTEAAASVLKWRSNTLLQGIKSLVNDQAFGDLAQRLYNHALIHPRGNGQAKSESDIVDAPAYVDPKQFADALIDVAGIAGGAPDAIKQAVAQKIADPQLRQFLNGVIDRTGGTLDGIRGELASWFDSAMDRVSGAYKRKTQLWSFIIALGIAAVLNVDSIHVGKTLWQQPMLTKTLEAKQTDTPAQTLDQLERLGLPVGWTAKTLDEFGAGTASRIVHAIQMLLGWAITAFATLFGAPFWFDALQQIIRLKGSGPSPAEKKANAGAAA